MNDKVQVATRPSRLETPTLPSSSRIIRKASSYRTRWGDGAVPHSDVTTSVCVTAGSTPGLNRVDHTYRAYHRNTNDT